MNRTEEKGEKGAGVRRNGGMGRGEGKRSRCGRGPVVGGGGGGEGGRGSVGWRGGVAVANDLESVS